MIVVRMRRKMTKMMIVCKHCHLCKRPHHPHIIPLHYGKSVEEIIKFLVACIDKKNADDDVEYE